MKTLVFARNADLGAKAAEEAGLQPDTYEYIGSAKKLVGRNTGELPRIIDPSFTEHPHHRVISEHLAIADSSAKPHSEEPTTTVADTTVEVLLIGYRRNDDEAEQEARDQAGDVGHLINATPTVHNGTSATRYTFATT